VGAALGSCASASGRLTATSPTSLARWVPAVHIHHPIDIAPPRSDGRLTVAADNHLLLMSPSGMVQPFARGASGYSNGRGSEPYIALAAGEPVPGAGCAFPRDTLYVLALSKHPGVIAVDPRGRARRFVSLVGRGLLNGITFDTTGRFAHRLLVTRAYRRRTTVFAIDCRRRVTVITRTAPQVEGGIAVAPPSFGRFAGLLVAPDELSGRIFAIATNGHVHRIADSGLPHGGDVGVESAAFVPSLFGAGTTAFLADRMSPGNAHPGDDVILTLSGQALQRAGVSAGDLLVATEGGARTVAVRCASTCQVRQVANGPVVSHPEGHIVFAPG
jgi:hypothetical protein